MLCRCGRTNWLEYIAREGSRAGTLDDKMYSELVWLKEKNYTRLNISSSISVPEGAGILGVPCGYS